MHYWRKGGHVLMSLVRGTAVAKLVDIKADQFIINKKSPQLPFIPY